VTKPGGGSKAADLLPLGASRRELAGQSELAHSASQIAVTRPWRAQITIRD